MCVPLPVCLEHLYTAHMPGVIELVYLIFPTVKCIARSIYLPSLLTVQLWFVVFAVGTALGEGEGTERTVLGRVALRLVLVVLLLRTRISAIGVLSSDTHTVLTVCCDYVPVMNLVTGCCTLVTFGCQCTMKHVKNIILALH